jgi:hypothetical protein
MEITRPATHYQRSPNALLRRAIASQEMMEESTLNRWVMMMSGLVVVLERWRESSAADVRKAQERCDGGEMSVSETPGPPESVVKRYIYIWLSSVIEQHPKWLSPNEWCTS